jgi:hypothetical protein
MRVGEGGRRMEAKKTTPRDWAMVMVVVQMAGARAL